jgi:2-amino-4-hydroxy-6-hydroxymethyldihydropteridine diphosphokinase
MESQHQVILSLGSNLGNRLENIFSCIQLIHQEIGTVIKTSKLYATPSWGFDSEEFYNCALVLHTFSPAEKILTQILSIETQLGRIRNNDNAYHSRIIDIDLIAFDEAVLNTEELIIPHPLMQNRKFVLLPMRDLNLDWKHPVFHKNILELLDETLDQSTCNIIM